MSKLPEVALVVGFSIFSFGIVKIIFRRISKTYGNLHIRFLEQALSLLVVIFGVVNTYEVYNPSFNLNQTLLRGSALVVGILGFAAQPAISDMICGFLISINKPFEIGDRIIVDGLEPGVVEDISLRHTVLKIYDDLRIVVPNSVMNQKVITNTSYQRKERGIHLQYSVSYETDIPYAMNLIRDAVVSSPYTLRIENNGIEEDSSPVYFLKFADSAIILETTIVVKPPTSNYKAATDVNIRVFESFREHDIEIPYNYVNVIEVDNEKKEVSTKKKLAKRDEPLKRVIMTEMVVLNEGNAAVDQAVSLAGEFAEKRHMDAKSANQIELIAEEAVLIISRLIEKDNTTFWIEGSGISYKIHIYIETQINQKSYVRLMNLSTSGKNEAVGGIAGAFQNVILRGLRVFSGDGSKEQNEYNWSLKNDSELQKDIGHSILVALSDDVSIKVTKEAVKLEISKTNKEPQQ